MLRKGVPELGCHHRNGGWGHMQKHLPSLLDLRVWVRFLWCLRYPGPSSFRVPNVKASLLKWSWKWTESLKSSCKSDIDKNPFRYLIIIRYHCHKYHSTTSLFYFWIIMKVDKLLTLTLSAAPNFDREDFLSGKVCTKAIQLQTIPLWDTVCRLQSNDKIPLAASSLGLFIFIPSELLVKEEVTLEDNVFGRSMHISPILVFLFYFFIII